MSLTPTVTGAVVVIVKVAKPWYVPEFLVTSKMRASIPQYATLPGLLHKAYAFSRPDGAFGGLYLWRDRTSADRWFSPDWFARVERERGTTGNVRIFEAPLVVEGVPEPTGVSMAAAVATLSLGVTPETSGERRIEGLRRDLSALQSAPGLLRAYGVVTDEGRTGVLAQWTTRAHAAPSSVPGGEWFDIPIRLRNAPHGEVVG